MKTNAVRWRVSKDSSWYATESEIYELVQTIREVADLDTAQEVESWAKTASVGDLYEVRDIVVEMVELEETEVCPHCEAEVTVVWDVEKQGYQTTCPNCGKKIMLCDACLNAEDNEYMRCDWFSNKEFPDGLCWRMAKEPKLVVTEEK